MANNHLGKLIAKLSDGLEVREISIQDVREQDVNAQVLPPAVLERLSENIRREGLTELPYGWVRKDLNRVEVISGHHRLKAATKAGRTSVHMVVDTRDLSRSEVVSRQLSHNRLHGEPDPEIEKELLMEVTAVDDLLATGLDEDFIASLPRTDTTSLFLPSPDFDWKTVVFTFLVHQFDKFDELVMNLDGEVNLIGVAGMDQFENFARVVANYARIRDIKSIGTTISQLTQLALDEIRAKELLTPNEDGEIQPVTGEEEWVPISALLRSRSIPLAAAKVINQALDKMMADGDTGPKNRWQALEYWAADYLNESGE
jgi:hypothetical protein